MAYQDTLLKGQKQQAIAQALAGQAFSPPQRQQGRIVAQTGLADGLGTLAAALASRRIGKKADTTLGQAEAEKRQMQAAALQGFNTPPNMVQTPQTQNPYARAQTGLEAGLDPNVVGEYMRNQRPQGPAGDGGTSLAGYRQAKLEGYEGSYTDYKKEFEGREANAPASWQEWEQFIRLPKDQQQAYLELKRNVPIETINQVPTRVLPGGGTQPLSTLDSEANAKTEIAQASAQGTENVVPVERRLDAQAKQPRIEAATRRLDRVAAASEALGTGGGPIEGRLRSAVGTPAAQELEAANAQLIGELTALTRVPGVGSQSDLEQRLAQLALPDASQHPEVRAKTVAELHAFIADLDAALQRVGGAPSGGASGEWGGGSPPIMPTAGGKSVSWSDL